MAQIENIQGDQKYTRLIKHVIGSLLKEIEKLHNENDAIMEKLDLVLEKLNGLN